MEPFSSCYTQSIFGSYYTPHSPNKLVNVLFSSDLNNNDRFVEFSKLCEDIGDAAVAIEYDETTWNEFSLELEKLDYGTIQSDSPDLIDPINMILEGNTEADYTASWDCYINHYESKSTFICVCMCGVIGRSNFLCA